MSNYSESYYDESNSNASWYKVFHYVKDGSKVLDVGCSSGNFGSELISRKNCIVDGIELDEQDVILARKNLRNVYRLNIETDSLDALGDDYDVIYFGDVIEHLVDPTKALIKVQKLLRRGGVVLFSIPNMAHISIRLLLLTGDFDYAETGLLDKTHLHFYNLKEVKRVFRDAGMEINSLDFVQRDYPEYVIGRQLEKLGLKASPKFYNSMKSADASAFQFVGTACVSNSKQSKTTLDKYSPNIDIHDQYFKLYSSEKEAKIKELEKEIKLLKKRWANLRDKPHLVALGIIKRKIRQKTAKS